MAFGTFRKTVNENPLECEEGDIVLEYEADDGTRVHALLLYDHDGYDTDTWGGNPVRHMEYGVGVAAPADMAEELEGPDGARTFGTKESARQECIALVEELVDRGLGGH
jgi:hypothetical protein